MSGGKLQKYRLNVKTNKILGHTHNQLVEGELRDRARPLPTPAAQLYSPKNPVSIEIVWEEEEDLPIGAAVALIEPVYLPADRPQAPLEGIRFKTRIATTEDVESGHFAITSEPVRAASGSTWSIGHAWIPAAVWAQVDVMSDAHKFADAVENEFILASAESGRYPIVWKPAEADGVEWCVVLLAGVGDEAGANIEVVLIDTILGAATTDGTVKPGVANLKRLVPIDTLFEGEREPSAETVRTLNYFQKEIDGSVVPYIGLVVAGILVNVDCAVFDVGEEEEEE